GRQRHHEEQTQPRIGRTEQPSEQGNQRNRRRQRPLPPVARYSDPRRIRRNRGAGDPPPPVHDPARNVSARYTKHAIIATAMASATFSPVSGKLAFSGTTPG